MIIIFRMFLDPSLQTICIIDTHGLTKAAHLNNFLIIESNRSASVKSIIPRVRQTPAQGPRLIRSIIANCLPSSHTYRFEFCSTSDRSLVYCLYLQRRPNFGCAANLAFTSSRSNNSERPRSFRGSGSRHYGYGSRNNVRWYVYMGHVRRIRDMTNFSNGSPCYFGLLNCLRIYITAVRHIRRLPRRKYIGSRPSDS